MVVYDEIHYLRDKERGVVWEESIILMPKSVRFAFLSATIPNAAEFAQWIAKTHRQGSDAFYASKIKMSGTLLIVSFAAAVSYSQLGYLISPRPHFQIL